MLDQQQQQIHRLCCEAQAASFPAQLVGGAVQFEVAEAKEPSIRGH